MLKFVFLILATASVILLIVSLVKGAKYSDLVENLDEEQYKGKDLFVIGFYLNSLPLFRLRGNLEHDLKAQAKLVWNNIYFEYYANLAWAQFLSYAMIVVSVGFCFCGLVGGTASLFGLMIIALFIAAVWNLTVSEMKEKVQKRREECEYEFPDMISKLSLLINSGMVLRAAWFFIAEGKDGALYDLMKESCKRMENGASERTAIYEFGVLSDSNEIKKFTGAMLQGMEKGNSELADFLLLQASEQLSHKRQIALQKGEVAAGKLILPLGIMFAGIIMIIVSAAMQSMSF